LHAISSALRPFGTGRPRIESRVGHAAALRGELAKAVTRGNVTLSLRLTRADETGAMLLSRAMLDTVLTAMAQVENEALERGVSLAPSKASDLLSLRGMMEAGAVEDDSAALIAQIKSEFAPLVRAFVQMRSDEGAALARILGDQLAQVAGLTAQAGDLARARKDAMAGVMKTNLARVMDNTQGADPDRVAQELAMIAVKADVTEEIDRLGAHVVAARALLKTGGAVGRKLDFLMQEFNREANTLCSKSQNTELTAVGLDLKAVIDQMREQVQNIE